MAAKKKGTKKKDVKKKAVRKIKPAPKEGSVSKKASKEAVTKVLKADIRTVGRYALLLTQKIKIEADLKAINGKITENTQPVLDYFQIQGVAQIAVGGRTLYLKREIHTSKNKEFTTPMACGVLYDMGLEDYVGDKINIQGLGTWVREKEADGEELADIAVELGGAFNVVEIFKIGSRKR